MDVDDTTEKAERKAPRISVNVHLDAATNVVVEKGNSGAWISINGHGYPSASLHMSREKLAEVRDVIAAYLESSK
jgi:hypothetical protein